MKRLHGWTGGQFSLVRITLGFYLMFHFISLIPWGTEVFSNEGVLPRASMSPLMMAFPNIFALADGPVVVAGVLISGVIFSVMLMLGFKRRFAALMLWYIWACLLGRNPFILNPGIPFVGWMLLFCVALPSGENLSFDAKRRDDFTPWFIPKSFIWVAWIVMVVGYSYSGLMKLNSPSWIDGSAILHVLESPLARPTFLRTWLTQLPFVLSLLTWATLGLEIAAAPLALIPRARRYLWFALIGLHVGILLTVDFSDLTVGMLMIHMLTFDPKWLKRRLPLASKPRIAFDGHCGLCHGFIRFVLAEDQENHFEFEPCGPQLTQVEIRFADPDMTIKGPQAVSYVLGQLGGLWVLVAWLINGTPNWISHRIYRKIAQHRKSISSLDIEGQCPIY